MATLLLSWQLCVWGGILPQKYASNCSHSLAFSMPNRSFSLHISRNRSANKKICVARKCLRSHQVILLLLFIGHFSQQFQRFTNALWCVKRNQNCINISHLPNRDDRNAMVFCPIHWLKSCEAGNYILGLRILQKSIQNSFLRIQMCNDSKSHVCPLLPSISEKAAD